ncbi:PREDICTED: uncharacterized protein LOC101309479 [Fragaria vesca subsp. vesca]|uniref:uncharacterized protein LOC101309479 n=1 Tax=Fragaria vesca subsp. vesca TaxID=101020 RepID=UPI0002C36867|nr:PREDICTED: uncharacterized protein LOC101309479 [Fragaria vesca subsp. vesca]
MSEMDMYGVDEEEEEFYEAIRILLMAIQAVIYVLYDLVLSIPDESIRRPLTRRPVTSNGYIYMNKILDGDPHIFREVYRMYPDVFRKFEPRMIFERSHFTVSKSFNKILKALNIIAPEFMAKPPSPNTTPPNIRESTRFYPFFKDCIGAIDGTHIPATVVGREVSRYRNRHGKISQNVLAACNFDLQFIYVLSGWEGSAHDSKVLNDAISRSSDEFPPEPEDDPVENEEDNFEWDDFQTQEQQRDNANQWRMSVANQMWAEAQANANNVNNDNEESNHEGEE